MNWLRYDSPLSEGVRFLGNMVILNLCYVLCCLPIITIGPANAALYAALNCDVDDTWPVRRFWCAIKNNFRQSLAIWATLLVPTVLTAVSFYLAGVLQLPGYHIIQGLLIVLFLVLACIKSFAYPLQARFNNTVKQTLRNAMVLGLCSPIPSVLMYALTMIPLIVFLVDVEVFTYVFSFWLVIGYALTTWINSGIVTKIIKRILPSS